MKILDWYIIKKFFSTYLFAILALTLIIVVFDTSERIDDFVEKKAPLKSIFLDYYANFVPYYINMFSALFTFIAVIFFTSKMAGHTEIVAMLSTGVSFARIMRPYMLVATIITLVNCYLANVVIPQSSVKMYEFEQKYIKNPYQNREKDIHRQTQKRCFTYIESFNVQNQIAYKFSLESFEHGELKSKLMSSHAKWDTTLNVWHVHNYHTRIITDTGQHIQHGRQMDTLINLTGQDLSVRVKKLVVTMGYTEINEYIDMLKLQGASNVNDILIEKYKRFAYPIASLILTVIGVALSSRKVRGGIGLHIGIGVGLSFAYVLFQRFSEMFVQADLMSPALALWVPNVVFIGIAFFLYKKMPK
ncbi:MAG: LptF/LptG family permease [Bacteroidales bacterium]